MHKLVEIEDLAKNILEKTPSLKHEIVDIILSVTHKVTIITNEEENQDKEWIERVKGLLTHHV